MAFQIPKVITPQEVSSQLKQGEQLYLLDVREDAEWEEGHVQGQNIFR